MTDRADRRGRRPPQPSISLSEEDGIRYLHFGSEWVQGAMRIARPFAIEIDYVRHMMAWMLLMDPPARILQLGLGAAALTKFCWRHLPQSEVTVVEYSRRVIDTAHQWFALPAEDERLQLVCEDAGRWIADPRRRGSFDVLQVDVYDAHARGPVLDTPAFYRDCRRALRAPSVMTVNLFGDDAGFADSFERIRRAFDGRAFALEPVPAGNRVVVAVAGPPLSATVEALARRAAAIEQRWKLPAADWAAQLQRWFGVPTNDPRARFVL